LILKNKYKWYGVVTTGTTKDEISNFSEIIPPIHIDLEKRTLADGRVAFRVQDIYRKKAVLDGEGKMVTDYVNWTIVPQFFSTETLIVVNNDTDKWGLADPFLKVLTPIENDLVQKFSTDERNYYVLSKNKKFGIYSKQEK